MKDKTIIRDGVEYKIMEIGGQTMEIRVAGKKEIDEFKADSARFKRSPMRYMKRLGREM